jgi:hypothetical protein
VDHSKNLVASSLTILRINPKNLAVDFEEQEIWEQYNSNVIENYLPKMKVAMGIVWVALLGSLIADKIIVDKVPASDVIWNRICLIIILIMCSIAWINFYPKQYTFIVPIVIGWTMESISSFAVSGNGDPSADVQIPALSFIFMLIIIVPSQVKLNWVVFCLGWVYYMYKLHVDKSLLTYDHVFWSIFTILYFTISSVISYMNLKFLIRQNYLSKKSAEETTRLLEVFPHGVIIQSGDSDDNFKVEFTNKEFNEQIRAIRNKVDELETVDIVEDNGEIEHNLHEFLIFKQAELKRDQVIKHKKLTIRWDSFPFSIRKILEPDDSEDDYQDKVFTVKSMKVSWNGKPCYMHVFFVNEDILMLEQANSNIKLQKIMFASVSHEFRTPLNAIIHSFGLSKNLYEQLIPIVQNMLQDTKDE